MFAYFSYHLGTFKVNNHRSLEKVKAHLLTFVCLTSLCDTQLLISGVGHFKILTHKDPSLGNHLSVVLALSIGTANDY